MAILIFSALHCICFTKPINVQLNNFGRKAGKLGMRFWGVNFGGGGVGGRLFLPWFDYPRQLKSAVPPWAFQWVCWNNGFLFPYQSVPVQTALIQETQQMVTGTRRRETAAVITHKAVWYATRVTLTIIYTGQSPARVWLTAAGAKKHRNVLVSTLSVA